MSREQPRAFDEAGEAHEFVREQTLVVVLDLALETSSGSADRCEL